METQSHDREGRRSIQEARRHEFRDRLKYLYLPWAWRPVEAKLEAGRLKVKVTSSRQGVLRVFRGYKKPKEWPDGYSLAVLEAFTRPMK